MKNYFVPLIVAVAGVHISFAVVLRIKRKRRTNSLDSSIKPRRKTMVATDFYLSDECWEHVFRFLMDEDNHCLETLSLVSKQFLSVTNHLRFCITIYEQSHAFLDRLFQRFPNLTSLDLSHFSGNLDTLLCQISHFPLNNLNFKSLNISNQSTIPTIGFQALGRSMKTLSSLTCYNLFSLQNNHLVLISKCFPFLEELDLSNPKDIDITEDGVKAMLRALPKLRKVNLSGHYYINNSLLLHLFRNCEFLEEVVMLNCTSITSDGIASAIREKPYLRTLSISWQSYGSHDNIKSRFIDSLLSLKSLTCLDFLSSHISDMLLSSIALEGIPLRRLVLQNCNSYSYDGIFSLLSRCRSIQHLDLQNAYFLNDQNVVELSSFLGNLVSINLSECKMLTKLALFSLIKKCPSLSDIKMESIGSKSQENYDSFMDFGVYPQLKSLYLARNSWLCDESIIMFASIFPNLQLLDLSFRHKYMKMVSEVVNCHVLKRCCKSMHLSLAYCSKMKLLGPKLEVLNLSNTMVDDETLHVITKNCYGIFQLLLKNCDNVTEKGVKHVLENCTQLREINMQNCYKVDADVIDSMVFIRPSLRKITAPPFFSCSDKKRKLFLRHGCLLL